MYPPPPIDMRPEVAAAVQAGQPVVALASAAIAHSLPWPDNLETARLAEAAARQAGAIPAFVAVWAGRLTVGLAPADVEAPARGASTLRASRRDLAGLVVRRATAATTVSASLHIANRAGVSLLVAGAVGGAAHGGPSVWDVSSDLVELSRTPVAVVSAGARSILDLEYTAEILESFSVPVIGFRTDSLPAFYQLTANQLASARVEEPAQAAALLVAHWGMGGAGVVVAQPTPASVALSPDELQPALAAVKRQAASAKVRSRDLPQFLMGRLDRLTGGRALRAYRATLEANARLAAQIACELTKAGPAAQ